MNLVFGILQGSPGRLNSGPRVLLVVALLGCAGLILYLVRNLLHLDRRLQAVDSQLSELTKGSGAS